MIDLKDALNIMKGKHIDIYTEHNLFDDQHIEVLNFIPITDRGIGFKHGKQNIYIEETEIKSYSIEGNRISINGERLIITMVKRA